MNLRRFSWVAGIAAVLGSAVTLGAQSVQTKDATAGAEADPYLWLEDVHGAKPLEWVQTQNAKALAVLKADPDYAKDYAAILKVMDATDRIPYGGLASATSPISGRTPQHPKGIWRRTTLPSTPRRTLHWEILLDLDKLAADEHENWVWKGADCTPELPALPPAALARRRRRGRGARVRSRHAQLHEGRLPARRGQVHQQLPG